MKKNKEFDLKKYLKEKGKLVDRLLKKYLPKDNSIISQAMRYSVLAGGKRLRPIFVMLGAESFKLDIKKIERLVEKNGKKEKEKFVEKEGSNEEN